MSKNNSSKSVNVFLSLDQASINSYFNKHDPSPIYKRQLSHHFEHYIRSSVSGARRFDPIFFKLNCTNEVDQQFAEPLLYAIRRHFAEKKAEEMKTFARYKKRNYAVVGISLIIVVLVNLLLPLVLSKQIADETGLAHLLDVFTWVIFFHPLDELLFNWNPHLKRILLMNKLTTAESIIMGNEKKVS
ncbi:MAG: hypothetical protein H7Y07_17495, partial [Pyrinomonadaceae bacterium]|nr:hypothetical protein [Sphingobacteriaceae bacterium]